MLRLGIIGCGRVTSMLHLKALEQLNEISVTAVSDINTQRMDQVKNECGALMAYTDYMQLVKDENVEAVAVNTPPCFHEEIVLNALENGKHVICEKPLAETVEGCLKIRDYQRKTGLCVQPAHNYSYSPSIFMMERVISEEKIGQITSVEASFEYYLKSYRSQTDFRENMENGIVEDVLPHILSITGLLVGKISSVESVNWWCKEYDVCDNVQIELLADSDIPISANMSWTKLRPRFSLTVNGEKGSLYSNLMLEPYKLKATVNGKKETLREKGVSWYFDLVRFKHPSFKNQYHHFHQMIKEQITPRITIDDEINIIETFEKVSSFLEL